MTMAGSHGAKQSSRFGRQAVRHIFQEKTMPEKVILKESKNASSNPKIAGPIMKLEKCALGGDEKKKKKGMKILSEVPMRYVNIISHILQMLTTRCDSGTFRLCIFWPFTEI